MFIVSVLLLSYQGMFTKLGPFKEFPNLHNKIQDRCIYIYTCDHIITCIAIDTTMCGSYRCIDIIKHIDIQKICRYNSFGNHARQNMFFGGRSPGRYDFRSGHRATGRGRGAGGGGPIDPS